MGKWSSGSAGRLQRSVREINAGRVSMLLRKFRTVDLSASTLARLCAVLFATTGNTETGIQRGLGSLTVLRVLSRPRAESSVLAHGKHGSDRPGSKLATATRRSFSFAIWHLAPIQAQLDRCYLGTFRSTVHDLSILSNKSPKEVLCGRASWPFIFIFLLECTRLHLYVRRRRRACRWLEFHRKSIHDADVVFDIAHRKYIDARTYICFDNICRMLEAEGKAKREETIFHRSFFSSPAGNIRRFRRVCEHIQSQVCSRNAGLALGNQSRAAPSSPRASRKFTTEMSESSSCGSDTSERLFLNPHPATRQVVCFNKVSQHLFIFVIRH